MEDIKIIEIYFCDAWRTHHSMGLQDIYSSLDPEMFNKAAEKILEGIDVEEDNLSTSLKETILEFQKTKSKDLAEEIFDAAAEQEIPYVEIKVLTLHENGIVDF